MAEKIVSPGVFTNERDLSFLPSGVAQIGAAIVGPTPKGPAFVPKIIRNFEEFKAYFGDINESYYVPYAVKSYLNSASSVTVVRVVSEGGYKAGAVNIFLTAATLQTNTLSYAIRTAVANDTGSSTANSLNLTNLTQYVALSALTASGDAVDASTLAGLVFYSGSAALTSTGKAGSTFVSESKYYAIYTASVVPASPASYTALLAGRYNSSAGATPVLVGTITPTTVIGSSTGIDYTKSTLPVSAITTGNFGFTLSGSGVTAQTLTGSAAASSNSNLTKVIGQGPTGTKKGYLYTWFQEHITANVGVLTFDSSSNANVDLSGSYSSYQPAATPWVTSQLIPGDVPARLFRVFTLGDGVAMNTSVKVSIINNSLAGQVPGSDYGTFTILVREYSDTDQRPVVLETYSNLNLDPDSPNYVARRIGDSAYSVASTGEVTTTGEYMNVSRYIRVQVSDAVKTKVASTSYNIWGCEAYYQTVSSSYNMPALKLVTSNPVINGAYNTKAYYGWDFTKEDNENYAKPLPNGATTGSNGVFNLDNCFISSDYGAALDSNSSLTANQSISGSTLKGQDVSTIAKFSLGLQSGFDGLDPAVPLKTSDQIVGTNTVGLNCNSVTTGGTLGYKKALNVLSNAETYDINMIVMPGISVADHSSVVTKAIEVAEDRGDTFVIADPVIKGKTVGQAVSAIANSGLNTSYAAAYWPWVKIMDVNRMKPIWVPPSVVLPRVIAQSDTAAFEWFAPAGLNRGGIQDAVDVESKLSFSQRDTLYEARINPLATFPAQGVCVWGQKTLQTKASALDRINVRRLMITLKKYIASSSRYLVFENNTNETRQRFINIVTPYLENVKARQGLYAFRVVMDETNNTPDVIDRNQLYGQIFLQPAKTAEFIVLDFNILPTGATFDNA